MQEMQPQRNVLDLLPKLKSMALADRAVFEKGMKAFVSYIQAYAKHECNLIFRIKGNSQQELGIFFCFLEGNIWFGKKKKNSQYYCPEATTTHFCSQRYFLQYPVVTEFLFA